MVHKKTRFKRLSAAMLFLLLFVCACAKPEVTGAGDVFTPAGRGFVEGGVHSYSSAPTEHMLVSGGTTPYSIVIPANATYYEEYASRELRLFFSEATGIMLEVLRDTDGFDDASKYISIGNTAIAQAAGVTADRAVLGEQGFIIKTVHRSVFLLGGEEQGSLYATYEFLTQTLDFDYFFTDNYSLKKNVQDLELMQYDILDIPDIPLRQNSYGVSRYSETNRNRMRMISFTDRRIATYGTTHNSFMWLPKALYQAAHPKWYASNGLQLSYSARGDESERTLMVAEVTERMKLALKEDTENRIIMLGHEDNLHFCSVDQAIAKEQYNGANSALIVKFLNDVNRGIRAWFETAEGEPYARDLEIMFFAYHATNAAPVKVENGVTVPCDETVVCDDGVVVFFAESNGDYTQSFYGDSSINGPIAQNMKNWAILSKKIYFWAYDTNFVNYLVPYNSFNTMQDLYKFAMENNAENFYLQGQGNQANASPGFSLLKHYLSSKFGWDVNADAAALTEKFFQNMYGPGAAAMTEAFALYRVQANYQTDKLGYNGSRSIFYDALKVELWPKDFLTKMLARMEDALEQIESVKADDPIAYARLAKNVAIEKTSFVYLMVELYGSSIVKDELNTLKYDWKQDLMSIGYSRLSEQKAIGTVLDSWGIN